MPTSQPKIPLSRRAGRATGRAWRWLTFRNKQFTERLVAAGASAGLAKVWAPLFCCWWSVFCSMQLSGWALWWSQQWPLVGLLHALMCLTPQRKLGGEMASQDTACTGAKSGSIQARKKNHDCGGHY